MPNIEFSIDGASAISISPNGNYYVSLTFNSDAEDVCGNLNESIVVDYFGEGKILEHIGIDAVKKYFGLIEEEA